MTSLLWVETGEPTCRCVSVSDLFSPAAPRSCQAAALWHRGGDLVSGTRQDGSRGASGQLV